MNLLNDKKDRKKKKIKHDIYYVGFSSTVYVLNHTNSNKSQITLLIAYS